MVRRQVLTLTTPTSLDRRTGRQPFPAIAVKRAGPRERVRLPVVWNPHVAHLRVQHSVHQPPFHHSTAANPGAHGHVEEGIKSLGRTPFTLPECCYVHISVESNGQVETAPDGAGQVYVLPARLRRRRNMTPMRRRGADVDWAEGRYANGRECFVFPLLFEERYHPADGFLGRCRKEFNAGAQVLRASSHRTYELCPSRLHRTNQTHRLNSCDSALQP